MSPDLDIVFLTVPNRLLHDQGVAGVEPTCDICMVNQGQEFKVWTTNVVSVLNMHQKRELPGLKPHTASPRSTLSKALCLIGGGAILSSFPTCTAR